MAQRISAALFFFITIEHIVSYTNPTRIGGFLLCF